MVHTAVIYSIPGLRRNGDYLVQVDKLTKGKKAFVIYLPKRGTKDMYVSKDWSEEEKK